MASPQDITVRIKKGSAPSRAAGAGWLFEGSLIVTCAHVVNAALGRELNSTEQQTLAQEVTVRAPRVAGQSPAERNWRVIRWKPPTFSDYGGFEGDVAFLAPVAGGFSSPPTVLGVRPTRLARCHVSGFPAQDDQGRSGFGHIGDLVGSCYEIVPDSATELPTQGFSGAPVLIGRDVAEIVSTVAKAGSRAYFTPVSALSEGRLRMEMLPAIGGKYSHIRDLLLELKKRDQRRQPGDQFDLRGAFLEDYAQIESFLRRTPAPSYGLESIPPDVLFNQVLAQNKPVLLSAPGGSGKTHFLIDITRVAMDRDYVPFWLDFSLPGDPADTGTLNPEKIFTLWSVAGGHDTFLSAGQDALIIGDGLNERSGLREHIASELAQLRRTRSASIILGDRLAQRRSRENFQLGTLSPLSVDVIRQHVGNSLQDVESWKRLLSSPFFLTLYLKVRNLETNDPLSRKEMFRLYFAKHVFQGDHDTWSPDGISLPAYNMYREIKNRTAPRSKWIEQGFKEADLTLLLEAGAMASVSHEKDLIEFSHQLLHDWLAASYVALQDRQGWTNDTFDDLTLREGSFDAIGMSAEKLPLETVTDFLICVYDWNWRAVLEVVLAFEQHQHGAESPEARVRASNCQRMGSCHAQCGTLGPSFRPA